jgi:hypothetical protein
MHEALVLLRLVFEALVGQPIPAATELTRGVGTPRLDSPSGDCSRSFQVVTPSERGESRIPGAEEVVPFMAVEGSLPAGKFNPWCQKRMIQKPDQPTAERANRHLKEQDLSPIERSALWFHEMTGAEGLELVAFSNARLDSSVVLSHGVVLMPCFLPQSAITGENIDEPMAQLTLKMSERVRYVYDGWAPIQDWTAPAVRAEVESIHESLSLFALVGRSWFEWEPKYHPGAGGPSPSFPVTEEGLSALGAWAQSLDGLSTEDRTALFRSIAWLAQGLRLTEPSARFLFSILAIESLATYIESDAPEDSIFARLRAEKLTRAQRKAQREDCIKAVLEEHLERDPTKAIDTAYFDCVQGIGSRLRTHLERVFRTSEVRDLVFAPDQEDVSLYMLRHLVAHGTANAISEADRDRIRTRVWKAEKAARSYILSFLANISGVNPPSSMAMSVQANFLEGVGEGVAYTGPTHLAELYA